MNDLTETASRAILALKARKAAAERARRTKTGTSVRGVVGCPEHPEKSEATRLLCTAAYRDEKFADGVIEILLPNDLSAIAHSEGIDLRPVLLHCLASAKKRRTRDLQLAVTLLLSILLAVLLSPWLLAIGFIVAFVFVLLDQKWHRSAIFHRLRRASFCNQPNPPEVPEPWVVDRLADIDAAQRGNVTVYADYSPFIGYGGSETSWSFALPIAPAKGIDGRTTSEDIIPFTTAELTDCIRLTLSSLAQRSKADAVGEYLEGLRVEDRVFVNGACLDVNGPFLLDRTEPPTTSLSAQEISEIAADPRGLARHYICAHVPSWDGQIVASIFLRFSTDGYIIYTECAHAILAPVGAEFLPEELSTDEIDFQKGSSLCAESLANVVPMLVRSPWRVIRSINFSSDCASRAEDLRKRAAEDLGFNYGASVSVRELFIDTHYQNYYQLADASKHLNILDRHTLEALAVFLEEHHVDTTDLRNRQTAILNEGVIQTGGISNIGAQAVGSGALASQNSLRSTAQAPQAASV